MSKDIVVLTPNARRVTIHCTPDTSILQILEDVCTRQGLEASDFDLKHHNKILDLTTTIRFSNLPNKACLEMVEIERQRRESNVIIGLQLEDGERRTGEFPPCTSLLDVISSLAPGELKNIQHPTIVYMRQEILGYESLKAKTLRQLGLLSGRAILRLLNKAADEKQRQANVSSVLKVRSEMKHKVNEEGNGHSSKSVTAKGKSDHHSTDPVSLIKQVKTEKTITHNKNASDVHKEVIPEDDEVSDEAAPVVEKPVYSTATKPRDDSIDTALLERRLNIEEEVTFLGAQKAIAFKQTDKPEESLEDLPDDFYELTIEEVRRLYRDLQVKRSELENTPLLTTEKREAKNKEVSEDKMRIYKNVVVRIQFPDNIILQGVFQPNDTVDDVTTFIKHYLDSPEKPFNIFSTTYKGNLEPKMSLCDAKFVPCVHLHFKWLHQESGQPCLKKDVYSNMTHSDAASILASKYRAPSRRNIENRNDKDKAIPSTSKSSKVPKWFKK